jgi:hypothetical protein
VCRRRAAYRRVLDLQTYNGPANRVLTVCKRIGGDGGSDTDTLKSKVGRERPSPHNKRHAYPVRCRAGDCLAGAERLVAGGDRAGENWVDLCSFFVLPKLMSTWAMYAAGGYRR